MARLSREQLLEKLQIATNTVKTGQIWRHTKTDSQYEIMGIGINERTNDIEIEYRELNHKSPITWHRSFDGEDGWIIPTEINNVLTPRFSKVI